MLFKIIRNLNVFIKISPNILQFSYKGLVISTKISTLQGKFPFLEFYLPELKEVVLYLAKLPNQRNSEEDPKIPDIIHFSTNELIHHHFPPK